MASEANSPSGDVLLPHWRSRPIQRRTSMGRNDSAIPQDVNVSSVESGDANARDCKGSSSSHTADAEVGYVSLRDLIAASPPGSLVLQAADIHMRHPLVTFMVRTYLRLTPSSVEVNPPRQSRLQRLLAWISSSCGPVWGCFSFVGRWFNCTLGGTDF
ncbi:hypothetical protein HPP92_011234 [Vanilla planifolia]|uniref:Uncharacterized protein n=1 Tax=Vanilla planifolia TaxID=51239 RepID=A0A835R819_VANPL|nr:hypothetical protein HPP92_011502 [Vanilla planifolia]KAG0483150.1 hypothetical protein HPP92_011234 [Vanilla planifolia]